MEDNKDLIQENSVEIIDETDNEVTEILKNFQTPKKDTNKKKKSSMLVKVLAGVLILALIVGGMFVFNECSANESNSTDVTEVALINTTRDENDVWQVSVALDEDGNIKQNGSGTLQNYQPAKIDTITIENEYGSFTVTSYTPVNEDGETDTTQYTLVGYEDFELQSGVPDEIANYAASTSFTTIVKANANLADYGLDDPRAVATVKFTDNSTAIIKVGDVAPQSENVYIAFGDNTNVYLVSKEYVSPFLYDVTQLISLTINDTVTDSADSQFEYVTISGSGFPQTITIEFNDDTDSIYNSYKLTSPKAQFADNENASLVTNSIRGLYAEKVMCVNPTVKQLEKYGLAEKYACVQAKYPDATIKLIASKADGDGNCYVMKDGGNIIYQIASSSVAWAVTPYEDLVSTYVLSPKITGLTSVKVDSADASYKFDLTTETVTSTDDSGNETDSTTTIVEYKGKELTLGYFEIYFNNMALIEKTDLETDTVSGNPTLTLTYSYNTARKADTVQFYKSKNSTYAVVVNGDVQGHVYASFVTNLIEQAPKVSKDIAVTSFW